MYDLSGIFEPVSCNGSDDMALEKSDLTNNYWADYVATSGIEPAEYAVVRFGDSGRMTDEFLELVLSGRKRATASLLRDYTLSTEAVPKAGDYVVVLDSTGKPGCIWRTTEVVAKPLADVDEAFAFDEGEGDRSRDGWLSAHRNYFTAQAQREKFEMSDNIETVFERFRIVWPLSAADPEDIPATVQAE